MSRHRHHIFHIPRATSRHIRVILIITVFVVAGLMLIQAINAATFSVPQEAESGTVAGNALAQDNSGASGGKSVKFGGGPPAPTGLRAFTGGDSIALQWKVPDTTPFINRYEVYRNGTRLAVTAPDPNVGGMRYGAQYMDKAVTRGQTYSYQVKAIDAINITSPLSASLSVTHPTNGSPAPTVTVDPKVAQYPELNTWLRNVGVPIAQNWYPKIVDMWARPDYTPTNNLTLTVFDDPNFYANGMLIGTGKVAFSPIHFKTDLEYSAGTVLHELVHAIHAGENGVTPGGWFLEGAANYASEGLMNALSQRNHQLNYNQAQWEHYALDPYYSGALLMEHIDQKIDPTYLHRMSVATRNGTLSPSLYSINGKSLDQIWSEYRNLPIRRGPVKSALAANKCIDVKDTRFVSRTKIQLWDCTGGFNQQISLGQMGDNTYGLIVAGKCLEVANNGTASGTVVWFEQCGKENDGKWSIMSDGSVRSSVAPNKCLDVSNSSTVNGAQLQIWECNGTNAQKWTLPQ